MKKPSRKDGPPIQSKRGGSAKEAGEEHTVLAKLSTPGIASLMVPIVLPLVILAIVIAANLSLEEPTRDLKSCGMPIAQQSLNGEGHTE